MIPTLIVRGNTITKKIPILALIVFLLVTSWPTTVQAQEETADTQETKTESGTDTDIPAYVIVYLENGATAYQCYGNGIDQNSVFELASNGKVVTAYIALQMVEEGTLSLDEPIAPYLDAKYLSNDPQMEEITVRQLLCHTAGFSPSFEFGVDQTIYTTPGDQFRYSGVGYIYLQNVIENASGMTLQQAAAHYVFDPLHMENSTFESAKTVTPYMKLSMALTYVLPLFFLLSLVIGILRFVIRRIRHCTGPMPKKGTIIGITIAAVVNLICILKIMPKVWIVFVCYCGLLALLLLLTRKTNRIFTMLSPCLTILLLVLSYILPCSIPLPQNPYEVPANSAYTLKSTGEDMALFCNELLQGYDKEASVPSLLMGEVVTINDTLAWGLGIGIETTNAGTTYWHSGINPGFQSILVLEPSAQKGIVILTNSDAGLSFAKEQARDYLNTDGTWDIPR